MSRASLRGLCLVLAALVAWSGIPVAADPIRLAALTPPSMRFAVRPAALVSPAALPAALVPPAALPQPRPAIPEPTLPQERVGSSAGLIGRWLFDQAWDWGLSVTGLFLGAPAAPGSNPFVDLTAEALLMPSRPPADRPINLYDAPIEAAAAGAASDRMMVRVPTDLPFIGAAPRWAPGSGRALPAFESLAGPWRQGNGVRYRVVYRDPLGVTWVKADGLLFMWPNGRVAANRNVRLPARYWGRYAIYERFQLVRYAVEIENAGSAAIERLVVWTGQEVFNRAGGPGRPLQSGGHSVAWGRLAPGERARVDASFITASAGESGSNFEQTHLTLTATGLGGENTVLADDAQAGVIDPPTP